MTMIGLMAQELELWSFR